MNRKRDAASQAQQQHEKPIDDNDMIANLETETPQVERIVDDGEPLGDSFA
jgi:hypothetical protein